VAPGKNRVIYLWGHLIAIHDAMFSILGLGPRLHPDLHAIFVDNYDKAVAEIPSAGQLKQHWDEVNGKLLAQLAPQLNVYISALYIRAAVKRCAIRSSSKIKRTEPWGLLK